MSLVGLADGIWSEVVLSDQEKSWRKCGDPVNVCGDLIKDDCDKYDDDDCDDCGDNTFCNVSIVDFENFMFPFSIK